MLGSPERTKHDPEENLPRKGKRKTRAGREGRLASLVAEKQSDRKEEDTQKFTNGFSESECFFRF